MNCGVCGRQMEVERNVLGFTSSIEAMAGHRRLHDHFRCPDVDAGWHERVRRLKDAADETPSRILARLYRAEAAAIVAQKAETRDDENKDRSG
jgi:hypothetical protein